MKFACKMPFALQLAAQQISQLIEIILLHSVELLAKNQNLGGDSRGLTSEGASARRRVRESEGGSSDSQSLMIGQP